jgi:hypothetical protein
MWIKEEFNLDATATVAISKPAHSVYNVLFNGNNPANYKPEKVMEKLHTLIYCWNLNNKKIVLNLAKLLVCIFIDQRFSIILKENSIDYITKDARIIKLHKLLRKNKGKKLKGKKMMKILGLEYEEIIRYFEDNFLTNNYKNHREFWRLIPD